MSGASARWNGDRDHRRAPVFVDASGLRWRVVRMTGRVSAALAFCYIILFVLAVLGVPWVPSVALPLGGSASPGGERPSELPRRVIAGDEAIGVGVATTAVAAPSDEDDAQLTGSGTPVVAEVAFIPTTLLDSVVRVPASPGEVESARPAALLPPPQPSPGVQLDSRPVGPVASVAPVAPVAPETSVPAVVDPNTLERLPSTTAPLPSVASDDGEVGTTAPAAAVAPTPAPPGARSPASGPTAVADSSPGASPDRRAAPGRSTDAPAPPPGQSKRDPSAADPPALGAAPDPIDGTPSGSPGSSPPSAQEPGPANRSVTSSPSPTGSDESNGPARAEPGGSGAAPNDHAGNRNKPGRP